MLIPKSTRIIVKKKVTDNMVEKIKKNIFALRDKIPPYSFYRYGINLYRRMKAKGKARLYKEEYFLKWYPFSKRKYYIIRMEYPGYVFFSAARTYIYAAEYARSKGMYPIMDLEWRIDFERGALKGKNLWDDIFRQKKIEEIIKEKATIVVSKIDAYDSLYLPETCIDINQDPMDYRIHATEENWREYYKNIHKYVRKYWRFSHQILSETNKKFTDILKREENVLGVSLRENFSQEYYVLIKNRDARKVYERHPLGPNVGDILDIVDQCLKRWGCSKIFVATVFDDSIKRFEERFPGRIIYCKRERMTITENIDKVNSRKKFIENSMGEDQELRDRAYRRGREYVQETLLLSKCTYLIGAKSGQTIAALSLNGGRYKDIKVLEDKNHVDSY